MIPIRHFTIPSIACSLLLASPGLPLHADNEDAATTEKESTASSKADTSPPTGPPPRGVDTLDQDALQQAFKVLREYYQHRDKLSDLEINRAALHGLLERHAPGAHLVPGGTNSANENPRFSFLAEQIDDHTAYIRLTRYSSEELAELEAALKAFHKDLKPDGSHLILDLRAPTEHREVAIAAKFLSYFLPEGKEVFRFTKPTTGKSRPFIFATRRLGTLWRKPLTVLIDEESGNIAELIAAGLTAHRPEVSSLGATTTGRGAEYLKIPLNESTAIRVAVASIQLPDGSSIFRKGITPDVRVDYPAVSKHARFRVADTEGIAVVSVDAMRPKLNEAALVDGANPEIDYDLLKSKGAISPHDLIQPKDPVIQRALDIITSRRFFKDFGSDEEPAKDKPEEGDTKAEENQSEDKDKEKEKKSGPKRLAPLPK